MLAMGVFVSGSSVWWMLYIKRPPRRQVEIATDVITSITNTRRGFPYRWIRCEIYEKTSISMINTMTRKY